MKSLLVYKWKDANGDMNTGETEYPTLKEAKERFKYLMEETIKLVQIAKVEYGKLWRNFYYPYEIIEIVVHADNDEKYDVKVCWDLENPEVVWGDKL